MPPPDPQIPKPEAPPEARERLLVRFSGDLTTKGRATRAQFTRRLVKNIKDSLRSEGVRSQVSRTHDRLYLDVAGAGHVDTLARVFGVQSLARVERRPWKSAADIVEAGIALFGDAVRGRRFAVRARRVGDRRRIAVQSKEIEIELGSALLPASEGVDLDDPEVTVSIEISPANAHYFATSVKGRGGLPIGVEGRAVTLVSGGFDSAVAAWLLLKRGVAQDYVFCNLGGRSHQLGTLRVMKVIADRWSYGTRPRFHAVDFDAVTRDLQSNAHMRYWQVLLKRLMLRAAEAVAAEAGAVATITGEAVGQVSSQTLQNLSVISSASSLPILRPLVGFNKDEILDIARDIGTFELSKVVGEYCAMVPRRPATGASAEEIAAEDARLDPELVRQAVAERSVFDLRALDLAKLDLPELEVSEVPADAVVLDLRSKHAFRGWHYPGALFLDFPHAIRAYPQFDRGKTYVLYCEFGLKSAHLAELMRADGIEAFHFKQGLGELLAYAKRQGIPIPELP